MNRDRWPDSAGLVSYARSRATGTTVGVYRNADAGFDDNGGADPWSTVCEDHAGVVSHPTRDLALRHAPHPDEWCPFCQVLGCPHGCCACLVWVDDQFYCPRCGDEWDYDTIATTALAAGTDLSALVVDRRG